VRIFGVGRAPGSGRICRRRSDMKLCQKKRKAPPKLDEKLGGGAWRVAAGRAIGRGMPLKAKSRRRAAARFVQALRPRGRCLGGSKRPTRIRAFPPFLQVAGGADTVARPRPVFTCRGGGVKAGRQRRAPPWDNDLFNSFMTGPDENGRFGDFGGGLCPETLMPLILEARGRI